MISDFDSSYWVSYDGVNNPIIRIFSNNSFYQLDVRSHEENLLKNRLFFNPQYVQDEIDIEYLNELFKLFRLKIKENNIDDVETVKDPLVLINMFEKFYRFIYNSEYFHRNCIDSDISIAYKVKNQKKWNLVTIEVQQKLRHIEINDEFIDRIKNLESPLKDIKKE